MDKQEHRCAHFGQVWHRAWTPFELCCDMNYRQRIIADTFCTNGCKFSFNGFRSVLQDSAMVWEWRCTQTKAVIFLDNSAQFQDSAVLCQDLSVLATLLCVVNNTHRKHRRMNKQEHCCAQFGHFWNNNVTWFEHNFDNENMIAEQCRNAYATQKNETANEILQYKNTNDFRKEKRRQRHGG